MTSTANNYDPPPNPRVLESVTVAEIGAVAEAADTVFPVIDGLRMQLNGRELREGPHAVWRSKVALDALTDLVADAIRLHAEGNRTRAHGCISAAIDYAKKFHQPRLLNGLYRAIVGTEVPDAQ